MLVRLLELALAPGAIPSRCRAAPRRGCSNSSSTGFFDRSLLRLPSDADRGRSAPRLVVARLTLRGEGATTFEVDATGPCERAVSTVSAGCRPDILIDAQYGPLLSASASASSKVGRNVEEAARVERALHKRPDVRRCVHASGGSLWRQR